MITSGISNGFFEGVAGGCEVWTFADAVRLGTCQPVSESSSAHLTLTKICSTGIARMHLF